MNDLIDRQAAIDAIDKYSVWVTYTQGDLQKDEAEFVENIIKQTKKAIQSMLIEDLPSAQPIQTASNYLQSLPTSPLLVGKMPSAQPDRSLWFHIGELCVDESKGNITAEVAIKKIRELLREAERRKE